jgi:hypothetical protein
MTIHAALLTSVCIPPSGPDGALLLLANDLEVLHSRAVGEETANDDDALYELLKQFWDVAGQIEDLRAATQEGLRAKGRALRCVLDQVGGTGKLQDHLEALLTDLLGPPETVAGGSR